MSIFLSKISPIELRLTNNLRHFATTLIRFENQNEGDNVYSVKPSARVVKLYNRTPPRKFEDRNKATLRAHKARRLELARFTEHPQQFKFPEPPQEPVIVKKERKLPSLVEMASPYERYTQEDIEGCQSHGTYFDPLFNPLLHEGRHRVDPDEEPFNAIYEDSTSESANDYTKVRNITSPDLWAYVEQLEPIRIAPQPRFRKPGEPIVPMPSGYVPPPEQPPDLPYHVARTRNYMMPVYYYLDDDPDKCYTLVKQVTGDLWKLQEDLRTHLEELNGNKKRILTSVDEASERVAFRGRYLHETVSWLQQQGF